MLTRLTLSPTLLCILSIGLLATHASLVACACIGDAPVFDDETLTCINDSWQSVGPIVLGNCSTARINGPTIINGDFKLDFRSVLTYEPHSLDAAPFITVKGCATFNQSYIRINLTEQFNHDLVYADKLKQKNHWVYLMMIETSCPTMNVSTLQFQTEVHWPYGVSMNSTVIDSTKNKITYLPVAPGHSAIQMGFLGGSPLPPQPWFPAVLAILGCFVLIVVVGKIIDAITSHSIDKKVAKLSSHSINGDDSAGVALLDDTD